MLRTYDGDFDDCTCQPDDKVEILRNHNSKVLWINVNGSCVFRMRHIPKGSFVTTFGGPHHEPDPA